MLWHKKAGWDENLLQKTVQTVDGQTVQDPMAKEAVMLFKAWIEQIPLLRELRFPRWMGGPIQLLCVFGDASKSGMGVAAYVICKGDDSQLHSQLVFSKSSLMPQNLRAGAEVEDALAIARAELVALLMGVNVQGGAELASHPIFAENPQALTFNGKTRPSNYLVGSY